MRAVAALFLSFVACTLAYTVVSPNGQDGWTNQGSQNLTWTRVDTDPLNFTVVLDNQNITGFERQVLAALVDGTLGFTELNSHNGGWPTGSNFRVNFVKDDDDLDAILAQSSQFDITEANTSSTSTASIQTTSFSIPTSTATTPATGTSSITTIPTGGAAASYPIQTGLLALFSFLGFVLA